MEENYTHQPINNIYLDFKLLLEGNYILEMRYK